MQQDPDKYKQKLDTLLSRYEDVFEFTKSAVSSLPPVNVKLKPDAKGKL